MTDPASTRVDLTGIGSTKATATTTKSSGVASFNVGGYVVTAQVARDLTIAAGDVCILTRIGHEWFALGRVYTAAPADPLNPALPDPKPSAVSGMLIMAAVETRTYVDSAWRTTDDLVIQGQTGPAGNATGCAFYGAGPLALESATIVSATVSLFRPARGGTPGAAALTLRLITETAVPTGAPTLTSSTAGPSLKWGDNTDFAIPTSWVDSLKTGAAGGIGVFDADGSPYVELAGRGGYPNSFTLKINYTR